MSTIVTRAGKGSPLTHDEVDANFTNLNADKIEGSNNLSDLSNATNARTNLGLGSIATQSASSVSITGGSITGITDITVADGGTGASTAADARVNLLPSYTGNGGRVLAVNAGATDVEYISVTGTGSVTTVSVASANGFTGTVANATTTPAITLRTSITGILQGNGTAISAASTTGTGNIVLDTSPTLTTPTLGTPASGNLSNCTVDGTNSVGYKNVPQNSRSAAYTLVLDDSGKVIHHPSTDANARTFTIPANSSVAYPIGTVLTFTNMTSQVVTIAITTDTMFLAGTGTTGSRSLAQYGIATAMKLTSTTWLISGNGLT